MAEEEEEWTGYDGGAVQEWHRTASRIRVASGVTVIPERSFLGFRDLRAVDLNNVVAISKTAFFLCTSLEHIIWPASSAVEIGESAFQLCSSLREIDLGNITKIGAQAFYNCHALERVTIPSPVAEIDAAAFRGCSSLAEVELGEGIQRIGAGAFYNCSNLVRITIPVSVTNIEAHAFHNCSMLVHLKLNEGLQRVGESAFRKCASLLRISIPSTTANVGKHAFAQCDRLRHAEFQEGLQSIGEGAFSRCNSLESITIPSSVTSLEHINIPPVAFVIGIQGGTCELMRSTMPRPRYRTVVASKWLQYRSPSQLEQAEAKVNEILGCRQQREDQKVALIREWFAYYDLLDVTTMLELAIWRCNNGNVRDSEARKVSRRRCGNDMNIIIPGVLNCLKE